MGRSRNTVAEWPHADGRLAPCNANDHMASAVATGAPGKNVCGLADDAWTARDTPNITPGVAPSPSCQTDTDAPYCTSSRERSSVTLCPTAQQARPWQLPPAVDTAFDSAYLKHRSEMAVWPLEFLKTFSARCSRTTGWLFWLSDSCHGLTRGGFQVDEARPWPPGSR